MIEHTGKADQVSIQVDEKLRLPPHYQIAERAQELNHLVLGVLIY